MGKGNENLRRGETLFVISSYPWSVFSSNERGGRFIGKNWSSNGWTIENRRKEEGKG